MAPRRQQAGTSGTPRPGRHLPSPSMKLLPPGVGTLNFEAPLPAQSSPHLLRVATVQVAMSGFTPPEGSQKVMPLPHN